MDGKGDVIEEYALPNCWTIVNGDKSVGLQSIKRINVDNSEEIMEKDLGEDHNNKKGIE